jgi:hypothetical protein
VRRDQVDCADAVSEAAKRQLLLNVVKLSYGDTPTSSRSLVAGYTLQGRLSLAGDFDREVGVFGRYFDFGLGGTFSDHPTVPYAPLQGSAFAELMLKPISPNSLFAVILAGGSRGSCSGSRSAPSTASTTGRAGRAASCRSGGNSTRSCA